MLRYLVSLQTLDVYVMLYSSWGAGYKTIYSICCKIVCWVLFFLSGKIHHAIAKRVTWLSMENAKALHGALFGLQYNDPSLTVYFHIYFPGDARGTRFLSWGLEKPWNVFSCPRHIYFCCAVVANFFPKLERGSPENFGSTLATPLTVHQWRARNPLPRMYSSRLWFLSQPGIKQVGAGISCFEVQGRKVTASHPIWMDTS